MPLMPPRVATSATADNRTSRSHEIYQSAAEPIRRTGSATGLGFELGSLGRANRTQSDLAGFQLLLGGRFFARMPVFDDFYLVPSLGYFQKRESAGSAGVTQHLFEGGLAVYYNAWTGKKARWLVGGVMRVDYALSEIHAFNSSSTGDGAFRFRAGPSTGFALGISPEWSFVTNVEVGFSFGDATRLHPGLTAGLIFYLP